MATEATLRAAVEKIIEEGDLTSLNFKKIFHILEEQFGEDLRSWKKFLRRTISKIVVRKGKEQRESQLENGEIIKKNSSGDEEEDVDILGDKDTASQSPPKKKKDEEDELVDIECIDEAPEYIEASEKDRALQELIYESLKYGSTSLGRGSRSKRKKPALAVPPKKKAKRVVAVKNEDGTKKKAAGFSKPTVLSPPLAEFLGAEQLPRTEVVKRLHTYIKDHNLQSAKDRRKILFDEKLQDIFKCKGSDFFKINRLISKHVKPVDEVV